MALRLGQHLAARRRWLTLGETLEAATAHACASQRWRLLSIRCRAPTLATAPPFSCGDSRASRRWRLLSLRYRAANARPFFASASQPPSDPIRWRRLLIRSRAAAARSQMGSEAAEVTEGAVAVGQPAEEAALRSRTALELEAVRKQEAVRCARERALDKLAAAKASVEAAIMAREARAAARARGRAEAMAAPQPTVGDPGEQTVRHHEGPQAGNGPARPRRQRRGARRGHTQGGATARPTSPLGEG